MQDIPFPIKFHVLFNTFILIEKKGGVGKRGFPSPDSNGILNKNYQKLKNAKNVAINERSKKMRTPIYLN